MASLIGIIEEPGKWFEIKTFYFEWNPKAHIIAVEKIHALASPAFMIRIMVAVMSHNENKIVEHCLSDGKMPVKLCSLMAVIVSDELCNKTCRWCEMNNVLETEIPAVRGS